MIIVVEELEPGVTWVRTCYHYHYYSIVCIAIVIIEIIIVMIIIIIIIRSSLGSDTDMGFQALSGNAPLTALSGMPVCLYFLGVFWTNENARKWPSRLLGVLLLGGWEAVRDP